MFHPLALNSSRHWRRLRAESGGIDPSCKLRARIVSGFSPMWAPLRFLERTFVDSRLSADAIEQPPVFLLGHWRTGTTHLHNLFAQDPALGYMTTFQTVAPDTFFVGRHTLRPLMQLAMPSKRPMDNVPITTLSPQEEEFAMCNVTPHSFYVGLYFPRRMPELFRKYVLFEGVSETERSEWEHAYLTQLRKASIAAGGRRLVLKNPANTGRIAELLRLFPNAKFVHIHRDPFSVYRSTIHLYRKTFELIGLQRLSDEELERNVLSFYRELMRKYLEDRALIPEGNLVEVGFQELVDDGMGVMARIYESLGLPGFEEASPAMAQYLASQSGYKKNQFAMDGSLVDLIEQEWGFALNEWGYRRPRTLDSGSPTAPC